jgi:hypothetical protein
MKSLLACEGREKKVGKKLSDPQKFIHFYRGKFWQLKIYLHRIVNTVELGGIPCVKLKQTYYNAMGKHGDADKSTLSV